LCVFNTGLHGVFAQSVFSKSVLVIEVLRQHYRTKWIWSQ